MNEKPDRVAIWKQKYRDSEAKRVKVVRRAEASEFNFGQNVKELRTAEAEIKKLKAKLTKAWDENNRLQDEVDAAREEAKS